MDEITAYLPGLSPVENKELCVRFDGGRLSSDGGVLVLREIEKRLGLAARLKMGGLVVAIYIYQNREDDHIIDIGGVRKRTRVLLRRARSKSTFGGCITSSPSNVWILYPKQVLGFANEDGRENVHVGGFDQGPFAWEDYKGDYYELSAIDMELLDKIRRILSETEFELIVEWADKIRELSQHINWFANECCFPDSLEECYTENDKVCFFLNNIVNVLSRYFLDMKKQAFV